MTSPLPSSADPTVSVFECVREDRHYVCSIPLSELRDNLADTQPEDLDRVVRELEATGKSRIQEISTGAWFEYKLPTASAPIEKHPSRHPKHEGDKGQVLNGYCNRTDCRNPGANWFNKGTYGYYCRGCAGMINHGLRPVLCVEVDHQLTVAEMDALNKADMEARYGIAS